MGTRGLLTVINKEGEIKVSQYMQWDSYPGGQGIDILRLIQNKETLDKLEESLSRVRFLDVDGRDKQFVDAFDNTNPRTPEQEYWYNTFLHRDLGHRIIENIINVGGEIILQEQNSTWCEYFYTVDFQKREFQCVSVNSEPSQNFSLDDLPTDERFLELFSYQEEEDV
jgi:hypothetical protein